ncbi:hypothetical protein DXG01_001315, partial [Tephrocybe rancida]
LVSRAIPDAVLGLFVRTPLPSSEIFRYLPWRKERLDGMPGANLICFQTYSYSRHFTSTCVHPPNPQRDEFYTLLSITDLAVITPLHDGMNTTSMEFVIAQNNVSFLDAEGKEVKEGKNSPLMLSKFMGISKNMEDALLVNLWNLSDVAAAINTSLLMSPTGKARQQANLYKDVTTHTLHSLAAVLVKALLGQVDGQGQVRSTPYIEWGELV